MRKKLKFFPIYEKAISRIPLNFHINEENFIFCFISAQTQATQLCGESLQLRRRRDNRSINVSSACQTVPNIVHTDIWVLCIILYIYDAVHITTGRGAGGWILDTVHVNILIKIYSNLNCILLETP